MKTGKTKISPVCLNHFPSIASSHMFYYINPQTDCFDLSNFLEKKVSMVNFRFKRLSQKAYRLNFDHRDNKLTYVIYTQPIEFYSESIQDRAEHFVVEHMNGQQEYVLVSEIPSWFERKIGRLERQEFAV